MATVGMGVLRTPAFEFFDALRSYDVAGVMAYVSDDVRFMSPWSGGTLEGKEALEAHLAAWLAPSLERPSLTIADVSGDGAVIHLDVSISGRFGRQAAVYRMTLHVLKGQVRSVHIHK